MKTIKMVCCCCLPLFSAAPLPDDPRATHGNKWQTSMMDAPCKNPLPCCLAMTCFAPYIQYKLREKALGGVQHYKCCQGYYDDYDACGLLQLTDRVARGSSMCMFIEACCCEACAVSSTRMLMMDTLDIMPDPCDNRMIRFNNCMQCLSGWCNCLDCCEGATLIDLLADLTYMWTVGCLTAQMDLELKNNGRQPDFKNFKPKSQRYLYKTKGQNGGSAPQPQQMQRAGFGSPQVHPQG